MQNNVPHYIAWNTPDGCHLENFSIPRMTFRYEVDERTTDEQLVGIIERFIQANYRVHSLHCIIPGAVFFAVNCWVENILNRLQANQQVDLIDISNVPTAVFGENLSVTEVEQEIQRFSGGNNDSDVRAVMRIALRELRELYVNNECVVVRVTRRAVDYHYDYVLLNSPPSSQWRATSTVTPNGVPLPPIRGLEVSANYGTQYGEALICPHCSSQQGTRAMLEMHIESAHSSVANTAETVSEKPKTKVRKKLHIKTLALRKQRPQLFGDFENE